MTSIQNIIKLCQEEQGKVFILDHQGNLQLVIMGAAQYQALKGGNVTANDDAVDVEVVNRQITQAQLGDDIAGAQKSEGMHLIDEESAVGQPVSIKSVLKNWHKTQTRKPVFRQQDLREEVIDLSWNDGEVADAS